MHLKREVLRSFILGTLDLVETRQVIMHLLGSCRQCQELIAELGCGELRLGDTEAPPEVFDRAVMRRMRQWEAQLEEERSSARQLIQKLEGQPLGRRFMRLSSSPGCQTCGVCELLLEKSWEYRFDDAAVSADWAYLAVMVAEKLDTGVYGRLLVKDLEAQAWAYMGNAQTILARYDSTERALQVADELLEQGTGDPLLKARFMEFRASLRICQERFEEALVLQDRVMDLYRSSGDFHLEGVAITDKGVTCGSLDRYEDAIRLLRQGLALMDPEADLKTYLNARHNLATFLHMSGDLEESRQVLRENGPLIEQHGDRLAVARLNWLEGKIALDMGRSSAAEKAYLTARDEFLRQGIGFDAAEVSLELAAAYLREGRVAALRDLAVQMLPIFKATEMPKQALAAMLIFREAVETQVVTEELIGRFQRFLEDSQDNPHLEFEAD